MQASKLVIGDTYAVKRGGVLMRFRVIQVTTHRGTHTESNVTGHLVDDANRSTTMPVSDVIGPYEEQAELAEKARQEKAAREARDNAEKAAQDRLVKKFFNMSGLAKPSDKYSAPFQRHYGGGVEISKAGVEALLKFFDGKRV